MARVILSAQGDPEEHYDADCYDHDRGFPGWSYLIPDYNGVGSPGFSSAHADFDFEILIAIAVMIIIDDYH